MAEEPVPEKEGEKKIVHVYPLVKVKLNINL